QALQNVHLAMGPNQLVVWPRTFLSVWGKPDVYEILRSAGGRPAVGILRGTWPDGEHAVFLYADVNGSITVYDEIGPRGELADPSIFVGAPESTSLWAVTLDGHPLLGQTDVAQPAPAAQPAVPTGHAPAAAQGQSWGPASVQMQGPLAAQPTVQPPSRMPGLPSAAHVNQPPTPGVAGRVVPPTAPAAVPPPGPQSSVVDEVAMTEFIEDLAEPDRNWISQNWRGPVWVRTARRVAGPAAVVDFLLSVPFDHVEALVGGYVNGQPRAWIVRRDYGQVLAVQRFTHDTIPVDRVNFGDPNRMVMFAVSRTGQVLYGSGDAPMVRDTSSYWNPVRVPTLPRYTAIDRIPLSRIHSYNATGAAAVNALLDLQSRHLPTAQSLGVRTQQRPVARHLADDPYEAWHALDRLKTAESSPVIAVTLVRLDLDARTVGNAWTIGPNDPMPSGFIGNGKFYAFVLRQNSRPIDRAAVLGPEDSQGSRIDDSEDDRVDLPVAPTRPVELRDLLEQAPNGRDAIRALRAIENANGWQPTALTTTLDEFSGNAREVWQRLRNLQASAVPFVAVTVVRLGNNPNESGAWTITPDRIDNDRQPRGFQGPGRFHGFVLGADGARVAHDVVMDPPAPPAATEQAAPVDGGLPAPEATAAEQAQ